jgi:hypothetical protein
MKRGPDPLAFLYLYAFLRNMAKRKSAVSKPTGVERILALSDDDFEKWMDSVEQAGIKVKTK